MALNGRINLTSFISYYQPLFTIIDEWIDDIGEIACKYIFTEELNILPTNICEEIKGIPPVSLFLQNGEETVNIEIRLQSNIWFPYVFESQKANKSIIKRDNRQLALRHTPRLNSFLFHLERLCKALNIEYTFLSENIEDNYKGMVHRTGIFLTDLDNKI